MFPQSGPSTIIFFIASNLQFFVPDANTMFSLNIWLMCHFEGVTSTPVPCYLIFSSAEQNIYAQWKLLWLLDSVISQVSSTFLLTGFSATKLGRNDPYFAVFNNCSNGSSPLLNWELISRNKNFENLLAEITRSILYSLNILYVTSHSGPLPHLLKLSNSG